jgi:hypothetical protein
MLVNPQSELRRIPVKLRVGLRNRDYNILLTDYSYFQFAHSGEEGRLSMRFALYLNPFSPLSFDEVGSVDDSADFEVYFQLLEESEVNDAASAVRYDVAVQDRVELRHPAAHFHIGLHDSSRWPVDKILSPLVFTLLAAKLFYPERWGAGLDERLARSKAECSSFPPELFTNRERENLYLT